MITGLRRHATMLCALLASCLSLSACGSTVGGQQAKSSSAGSTSASISAPSTHLPRELLYAVLESHTGGAGGHQPFDTVAIAGLDGYARAKTTFAPLVAPYVGCLGPLFPPQAYPAAGRVFYIDGKGVVRSLGIDRSIMQVATFPVGTQQEASFAVSPDGKHLMGTVLTFPPKPSDSNGCATGGTGFAPGDWAEDIYAADAGGSVRLIAHRTWPQSESKVLDLVGWDARGPIATYPAAYGTQGGGPTRDGWYGTASRLDPSSGRTTQELGTTNCYTDDVASDGSYVCASADSVDVMNADGTVAWRFVKPGEGYMVPLLSPDLKRVAAIGSGDRPNTSGPVVLGKDGTSILIRGTQAGDPYNSGFFCTGWLDDQTLIGWSTTAPADEMTIVRLNAPSHLEDLGFRGSFVGVVQTG